MAGLEAIPDINCYTRQRRSFAAATQSRWCYLQVCTAPAVGLQVVDALAVVATAAVHRFCSFMCCADVLFCCKCVADLNICIDACRIPPKVKDEGQNQ